MKKCKKCKGELILGVSLIESFIPESEIYAFQKRKKSLPAKPKEIKAKVVVGIDYCEKCKTIDSLRIETH